MLIYDIIKRKKKFNDKEIFYFIIWLLEFFRKFDSSYVIYYYI